MFRIMILCCDALDKENVLAAISYYHNYASKNWACNNESSTCNVKTLSNFTLSDSQVEPV